MKSDLLKSYFAGFFDKSGSICDLKNRGPNYLKITITCSDIRPLEIGQKIWGGSITSSKVGKKTINYWVLVANQAKKFLNDIKEYSIVKKEKIGKFI